MKILIVSVGSLVGQNILDVLDYPQFNRRKYLTVIGTNSLEKSSNNFRCDKCYLVPNTATKEFAPSIINIIQRERPDLILCGRDEDTEVLWKINNLNPDLPGKLPYGNLESLIYALDKWQTWQFTQKHNLPFSETFMLGKGLNRDELNKFCENNQYPLIAKPRRGFASKGVFFVRNWEEALKASGFEGYILQEYLGEADANDEYFKEFDQGLVPLFSHAPNIHHYSCHMFIYPDGNISPVFISQNIHNSGATVGFTKINNKELEKLALKYAGALHKEGGAGPLTVQFRKNRNGIWKAQEINMRTNGNTFPRMLLGQDDLALIINTFLPEFCFPKYKVPEEEKDYIYFKTLMPMPVSRKQLDTLTSQKVWSDQQSIEIYSKKEIVIA